jgi:hypothetical protein
MDTSRFPLAAFRSRFQDGVEQDAAIRPAPLAMSRRAGPASLQPRQFDDGEGEDSKHAT